MFVVGECGCDPLHQTGKRAFTRRLCNRLFLNTAPQVPPTFGFHVSSICHQKKTFSIGSRFDIIPPCAILKSYHERTHICTHLSQKIRIKILRLRTQARDILFPIATQLQIVAPWERANNTEAALNDCRRGVSVRRRPSGDKPPDQALRLAFASLHPRPSGNMLAYPNNMKNQYVPPPPPAPPPPQTPSFAGQLEADTAISPCEPYYFHRLGLSDPFLNGRAGATPRTAPRSQRPIKSSDGH